MTHVHSSGRRRGLLGLAAGLLGPLAAPWARAAAVAPALDRPAQPVDQVERAVLLAGARAGQQIVAVGERGLLALSTDGGQHWRQVGLPTSVTLTAVSFADATHGAVVGHAGVVLVTEGGPERWRVALDGRRAAELALAAARASGDERALRDAQRWVAEGADKPFLDVLMSSPRDILAIGAYGMAFASSDGGQHWTTWMDRLPNPKGLHLYALRRRDSELVIVGEQGLLLRSGDAGARFEPLASPYKGSFFTVALPAGSSDIVVAGLRGQAWQSTDQGRGWRPLAGPGPVSITCSVQRPDGALLWGNQAGQVLALSDGELRPVASAAPAPINGLVAGDGAAVLALTFQGVRVLPLAKAVS